MTNATPDTKFTQPTNIAAERAVLAGMCKYAQEIFVDVKEIVNVNCFTTHHNQVVFKCVDDILSSGSTIDIPSIIAKGTVIGYGATLQDKQALDYITSLFKFNISKENAIKNSGVIRKLEIARKCQTIAKKIYVDLSAINGSEDIDSIISAVEKPIFDYTVGLGSESEDKTTLISDGIDEYVEHVQEIKQDMLGVPSPWSAYNEAIGGGRRRGGVYLIAARPKCLNINTLIMTPNGNKLLSDINIGDIICHPDGVTRVIHKYDTYEDDEYIVEFNNEYKISCNSSHLWPVKNPRSGDIVARSTIEIMNDMSDTYVGLSRSITNIYKTGNKINVTCIQVDAKDSSFILNNYITTHNCGKSSIAINDAIHVAKLNIPVLYLDTEMTKTGQWPRILACLSTQSMKSIESGKFADNDFLKTQIYDSVTKIKSYPFYYRKVAGKEFSEILSIIRRWIVQNVGTTNGVTNDCLLVYDYFKMMNTKELGDMKEYQAMGYQIQYLTDLCNTYDIPCSAFVQMNRDGITKDSTDVLSQSDRLLWLCSSLSLLKRKTNEEILTAGPHNGNMKLIVTPEQRYGPGLDEGDWINLSFDKTKCQIKELGINNSMTKGSGFNAVDAHTDMGTNEVDEDGFSDDDFDKFKSAYRDDSQRKY